MYSGPKLDQGSISTEDNGELITEKLPALGPVIVMSDSGISR